MTREGALLVMVAVAVVVLGLMLWGWIRRVRRDSGLVAPFGEPGAGTTVSATHTVLYVATTPHDRPLERLAVRGLGYRSRGVVQITTGGVVVALDGQGPILLAPDRIDAVGQSSVVIDRVVERDGLTRVSWRIDDDLVVDSYLRPQDVSARALADEISRALPPRTTASAPSGSAAPDSAAPAAEGDA